MYSLLRTLNAASNRAEREQRRRQRELTRQLKQLEKEDQLARAKLEVQEYENYIEVLKTVHKECGDTWNWVEIIKSEIPAPPQKGDKNENKAKKTRENYKPSLKEKVLRQVERRIQSLEDGVELAQKQDEKEFKQAIEEYESQLVLFKELQKLGQGITQGELSEYVEALNRFNQFDEIKELGSDIQPHMYNKDVIEISLNVNSEKVVPRDQKILLKTGKLSIKPLPVTRFFEIYQDYVCSVVLRVAREIFALLPVEMIIITAKSNLLNSVTGHIEKQPILSVAIPRKTLGSLNFDLVDPSDSLVNFVHTIKFKKSKGFEAIELIQPQKISL